MKIQNIECIFSSMNTEALFFWIWGQSILKLNSSSLHPFLYIFGRWIQWWFFKVARLDLVMTWKYKQISDYFLIFKLWTPKIFFQYMGERIIGFRKYKLISQSFKIVRNQVIFAEIHYMAKLFISASMRTSKLNFSLRT